MVLLLLQQGEDANEVSYDLYEPLNLDQPVISKVIDLNQFFDTSHFHYSHSIHYLDGCLFLSVSDRDYTCTHFLIVSIPTQKALAIPQFNHPKGFPFQSSLKAVSTYPADPDCVFLALLVGNHHHWSIGIFRHGDTQWTTTEFDFTEPFGEPCLGYAVFIRGVFYFLCYDQRLASYDIASGELKVDSFSAPLDYKGIYKFFGLDGELMLMYYDYKVNKHFLTSYDWSQKLWVPLKNFGDRSLFLSDYSVYVDYYGVSPNKIYVLRHGICCVYSFENGELVESSSSGLEYWSGLNYFWSMWVEPSDLLPK